MLNLLVLSVCLVMAPEWEPFSASATPGSRSIGCQLLRPSNETEPKPLLVILHGSGERGHDNRLQLKFLPQLMASAKRRAEFPCYVLVPQCPPNEMWSVLSRTRGVCRDALRVILPVFGRQNSAVRKRIRNRICSGRVLAASCRN